jgi:UDP-glucose 4-epimerase
MSASQALQNFGGLPQKVLVTGGAGFIGANLARMLLNLGYVVMVIDNLAVGRRGYLDTLPVELIEGDVLDYALVEKAVGACDAVVHLAAETGVPDSLAHPKQNCLVNVIGTLNLLEACRIRQEKEGKSLARFVFASSNAPLGGQDPPAAEHKAPRPLSPYGASKLAGEGYCSAYHGSWGLGTVALRFANVYGPFSAHKKSVVANFLLNLLTSRTITIQGDGQQTRDFIYVEDLCRAIVTALESRVSGEIFQIATGVETSILELAHLLEEVVGVEVQAITTEGRRGDIQKNYATIEKARAMLGWAPRVSLREGLAHTWQWFQRNGYAE